MRYETLDPKDQFSARDVYRRMIGVLLDPECSPIIEEQLILACDFRATASLVGGKHQVRREQGLMVA